MEWLELECNFFWDSNIFRDQIMNFTENIIWYTECKKTVRKKGFEEGSLSLNWVFDSPFEVLNLSGQLFEQKQSTEILWVLLRIRLPLAD